MAGLFLFEADAAFDGRAEKHDAFVFADNARAGDHFDVDVVEEETVDEDGEFFELDEVGDDELTGIFNLAVFDMFLDVLGRLVDWIFFVGRSAVVDVSVDENFGGETFVFGFDWIVGAIWKADFGNDGAGEHEAVNWGGSGGVSDAGELLAEVFVDLHKVHAVWSGICIRAESGGHWEKNADMAVFLHSGEHFGDGVFGDDAVGV